MLWKDLRLALRQLRRTPAFTITVLATLGLCIGVNTAIYSVLDAVLLRPAPYPGADRLAMVNTVFWQNGAENFQNGQNGRLYEETRDGASLLDVAALGGASGVNFFAPGHVEFVQQQRVASGYFRVLGVPPQFGREFLRAEDIPSGPPVTVLSYDFWQRNFNGDPTVIGKAINLRGEPFTVIGVMPKGFVNSPKVDLWTPLRPSRRGEGGGINYQVIARLRPGVSWTQANEQLKALSVGLRAGSGARSSYFEQRVVPLQTGLTRGVRTELLITWAAVLAVLLIGCVNIAGLLTARSATRTREIATRMALGGGRSAIIRQLLVESLVLALGGCVLGIGVGALTINWLKDLGAQHFEAWHPIAIDARVTLAMLAVAVLTSLVFGLLPAISTSRLDIRSVLSEGGRGNSGGTRHWTRRALVACEVALTLVLLVSAGLLVRTLDYLNGVRPGFDPHNLISAEASLQDARYQTGAAVSRLYTQSTGRMRQIPGVENAAVALTLPFERPLNTGFRTLDGIDREGHGVEAVYSTPTYFETMRIPVLRGRSYRDSDTADSAPVAVVSESFAAKYFRGMDALGRHLNLGDPAPVEIIGIVGDVQQRSGLRNLGPVSVEPTIYIPVTQFSGFQMVHTWFSPKWVVRAAGPLGPLAAQIQSAVAGVDPQLPIARFRTIEDLQALNTRDQRYNAALFSIVAGLALLLAAIGLYGLISQSISQRTHELGIRLALGATTGQTMATAIRPAILLVLAGTVAGAILSRLTVTLLQHLLYGIRASDPFTLAATAGILLLVGLLASLIPTLRILRLDPARTLRSE